MSVYWTEYQNRKILINDLSNISDQDQLLKQVNQQKEIYTQNEGKILLLYDATDAGVGVNFVNTMKKLGKTIFAPKTEKSAVIGMTPIKRLLLKTYNEYANDNIKPFTTKEEALNYLVSQ